MFTKEYVNVYGAGLAGCEAAWQIAQRGIRVRLYEMKPKKFTPAHHSDGFAELVCSNSLRSDRLTNGVGETITDTGKYALSVIGKKAEGLLFHIEPVEDYFYKITNTEGKAFDLQEQMLLEGTPVGLYPYGPSVSADTRNWQLIPIRL